MPARWRRRRRPLRRRDPRPRGRRRPGCKAAAREAACAAAASGEYGERELTIPVNGADTEWHHADLAAACAAGPDAIVVPKVDSAEAVLTLVDAMARHGAPDHTTLWAMVETPRAMLHAEEVGDPRPSGSRCW